MNTKFLKRKNTWKYFIKNLLHQVPTNNLPKIPRDSSILRHILTKLTIPHTPPNLPSSKQFPRLTSRRNYAELGLPTEDLITPVTTVELQRLTGYNVPHKTQPGELSMFPNRHGRAMSGIPQLSPSCSN